VTATTVNNEYLREELRKEFGAMSQTVDDLLLDLLEWIGSHRRPYAEVLRVWRTSCPRLPIWEEANDRGFIEHHVEQGQAALVSVSYLGIEHLEASGRKVSSRRLPLG